MSPKFSVLVVGVLACSCAEQPKPSHPPTSLIQLSACELGRYSDYVGRFEVVALKAGTDEFGLTPCTLRLSQVLVARPANDSRSFAGDSPVEALRGAKAGAEISAKLALPADAKIAVGARLVGFLTYSSAFSTWADYNSQGVFVENSGKWSNGLGYAGSAAISEMELLAEATRGSTLSRAGGSPCDVNSVGLSDGGSDSDAGR